VAAELSGHRERYRFERAATCGRNLRKETGVSTHGYEEENEEESKESEEVAPRLENSFAIILIKEKRGR
jgi:hypothetical protein